MSLLGLIAILSVLLVFGPTPEFTEFVALLVLGALWLVAETGEDWLRRRWH
jgi:hypothetical protein